MRNSGQINRIGQLIAAINENRNFEEISQIILGIEDVNQAKTNGDTPLLVAAYHGHTAIVAQLLAAGADVNQADKDGKTPLFIAAYKGHTEIVAQLLAAEGIDVNQASQCGNTPLNWAAFMGHTAIVAQLLAAEGIDVNQANEVGETPLYEAAQKGHVEIIAQLLAAGADETLLTKAQKTRCVEAIDAGKALLITNTRSSACALADIGQELQRVSIIQNHSCREASDSQVNEKKLPELSESILAKIATYATDLQSPHNLTQEQITKCAEVGTESIEGTDMLGFFHFGAKFLENNSGDTICNILNRSQNSNSGQVQRG